VDEHGNEVYQAVVDVRDEEDVQGGVAPPHPDVEGQNPKTGGSPESQAANAEEEEAEKTEEVPEDKPSAKPASDAPEATKGEL